LSTKKQASAIRAVGQLLQVLAWLGGANSP